MDILQEIRQYAFICSERVAVRSCAQGRETAPGAEKYPGRGSGGQAQTAMSGMAEEPGNCGVGEETVLTYGELWAYSGRLMDWLIGHSGPGNTPVPVYGHKHPWMLDCFLACVRAGHAYCPIDVSVPDERVRILCWRTCRPRRSSPIHNSK